MYPSDPFSHSIDYSLPNSKEKVRQIMDCHVHIGKFQNKNNQPEDVIKTLRNIGVSRWAFMPVSNLNLKSFINDLVIYKKVKELAPHETEIILLATPEMLIMSPDFTKYDVVDFKMIKVHGYLHQWNPIGTSLTRLMSIANERSLPIMFHTGGRPQCESGKYSSLASQFRNVSIILAHGRPIRQAIRVMKKCDNVYVDTAFMPIDDIRLLVNEGLSERVIFGTDFPINRHFYKKIPDEVWYKTIVNGLIQEFGEDFFKKWSNVNFIKFFGENDNGN